MGVMKQSGFDVGTRRWFKIGAASFILGTLLLMVVNILHPHQADPNNNPAVFAEYAADTRWVATHLMQLFGTLLFMVPGFLSVYAALENQGSGTKGLARLGLAMSLLTFAVYAVDMGIDGIALKKAVDRWAAATGSEQAIYFGVAEGIRWLENGVLGIAATLQGLVILLFLFGAGGQGRGDGKGQQQGGWFGGGLVQGHSGLRYFWRDGSGGSLPRDES